MSFEVIVAIVWIVGFFISLGGGAYLLSKDGTSTDADIFHAGIAVFLISVFWPVFLPITGIFFGGALFVTFLVWLLRGMK